ncbi:MAG: hypothetical protein KGZ58_04430 [Ignavibacteriales bacterium]|nr:hypothetical protein [Ignavibacteriales bacterium]
MTENKFEPKQIERYRKMTGEERVEIAFQLTEFIQNVSRDGIRYQHPEFSEQEIEVELQRRIKYGNSR